MKVLELLDEIEEIVETGSSVPLTGKVIIDGEDLLEVVREIKVELPDEIQQASWIKGERNRILEEAKQEYEAILADARKQAEALVEGDEVVVRAKNRADEIVRVAQENAHNLKMGTFDYIDGILYNFQDKMDQLNAVYFNDMFEKLQRTFDAVNGTLADNRNEIKEMIFRAQNEAETK